MEVQKGQAPELIESEVIYIDDDSDSTLSLSKKSPKKHRKVKVEKNNNRETLVISQEVKVKKQKIQCIINLDNYSENEKMGNFRKCHKKEKHRKRVLKAQTELKSPEISIEEQSQPKPSLKLNWTGHGVPKRSPKVDLSVKVERIVPHCLRKRCRPTITTKCCRQRHRDRRTSQKYSKHLLDSNTTGSMSFNYDTQSSSPIPMGPELEDVSSDSFTVCSDEPLDTLIKRTKDRERRLSKMFEYKPPLKASTPKNFEASDTETVHIRSEADTSMTTLILEPQCYPNIVKNEVTENRTEDLHSYGTSVGIKQEQKASLIDYSPNVPALWLANKDLKETKYFNKFPNVMPMPKIKVENSIDFTTFTENHINLRIKTEVNVKHEL